MKNLFKNLMLVAVAAMGFTACEQVIDDVNAGIDENTVTMTFVAGAPESRTSVSIDDDGDVAKYSWSAGDKVGFYYVDADADDNATGKKKGSNAAAIADDGTATFNASFDVIKDASAYNIGAFYPSESWVGHVNTYPFNNVKVKIPAGQALTDGSFDRNADLMMSKPFMGVALNTLNKDTVFALEFSRIAAIGKMNLKLKGMEEGEIINKVRFSFADGTHFNGPVSLDLENGDYTLATVDTSNCVELSGELAANADRTAIYFTCFPGEYSGNYTIDVTTDKATYSKTGTLSNALSFSAGDVLNFNATVENRDVKEEVVVCTLVTDASTLAVGDKVVIVSKDYNAAMSTAQNENNRGQVAVTKNDNNNTKTIAYVDGLQILTLEAGKTSGTFAFNTGSGYLYAASSSKNYLRTETKLSDNSSFTITIDENGVATVKAQGTNTRNWMRYNHSSSLFSCYGSGQLDICIYKLVGEYTPTVPAISYTIEDVDVEYDATIGEAAVAATNGDGWNLSATTDADWVSELVCTVSKISFKVGRNDAEESREATVTVTATKAGYDDVTVTFTITQGAKPAGGTEQPGEGGDDEPVLVEKTATLSFADKAQRTTFDTSKQVWEQNGIIFTNTKTNDSNNVADYANPVRCYQNSSITIEAPGEIKTITIDCSGLDNKYITSWGGTVTNKIVTITLEGTSNTYTISKLSAQARAYTISVTYMGEEE